MSRPTPVRALAATPRQRRRARRLARRLERRLEREVTAASVHAGLRAATATVAPLALAYVTGRHELVLAGVGGWLTCMADVGGAPRTRARAMSAYVVLGALTYAGGVLASSLPAPAVALAVALVAAGGGLLRTGGDAGATLGVLAGATFCAAVATPARAHGLAALPAALAGAGFLAAGSVWAMLLALVVWPVRPYAAARDAAAVCYRALAGFARGTGEAVAGTLADAGAGPRLFTALAREEHPRVRAAIQAARGVLVATRRGRLGGSRRADDVAVLLDGADALFRTLLTAAEAAEAGVAAAGSADPALAADGRALAGALVAFGTVLDEVAAAVPSGRRAGRPPPSLPALEAVVVRLAEMGHGHAVGADGRGRDALRHVGALLEHAVGEAERAASVAAALAADAGDPGDGREVPAAGWVPVAARGGVVLRGAVRGAMRAAGRDAAAWARAVTSPDAPTARHALRLGVAVGVAQLVGALLPVTRGPWITITTIIVLQPSAGLTLSRSVARVVGTVAGGVVAALLAAGLRDPRLIAAAAFVLAGSAVALRTVHYGVFTFFLTPVFVLIAQPAPGNWMLAGVRVVDTVLGGVVAVLAGTLLWPAWEAASLPGTAAAAVEAARAHLALAARVATAVTDRDGAGAEPAVPPQALARARRRAGLAATAGEGALERLLAEPRGRRRGAALLALLARTRRVNGAATALAAFGPAPHAAGAARVASLCAEVDGLLAGVAEAGRAGRAPGPVSAGLVRLLDDGARAGGEDDVVPPAGDVVRTAERMVPDVPAWGTAVRVARHAVGMHAAAGRLFGGGRG